MTARPDEPHSGTPQELLDRDNARRRGSPFLLYRDDRQRQHIIHLDPDFGRVSIGRHPASDLSIWWDDEASRLHAELEIVSDEWTIVDDGRSRNGTFVNGDRVLGRRVLDDGDVLRIGRTILVYRASANRADSATTRPVAGADLELSRAQTRVLIELCRPFATASLASPASNRRIAAELFLSIETVKTHMKALFDAFGIPDMPQNEKRAALAREAFDRGVLRRDQYRG